MTGKNDEIRKAILEEFAFLLTRGFVAVRETETSVRFESNDGIFVDVIRGDWRDGYVDYVVGSTAVPEEALSRGDLSDLMWRGVITKVGAIPWPDYTDVTHATIARAAEELRRHEPRVLSGELLRDQTARTVVHELRSAYTKKYMERRNHDR